MPSGAQTNNGRLWDMEEIHGLVDNSFVDAQEGCEMGVIHKLCLCFLSIHQSIGSSNPCHQSCVSRVEL